MKPHTIFVHCTATRPEWWKTRTTNQKVAEIRRWHVEDRGWRDIGYHFLIDRNGKVATGRPETQQGAHVRGHNRDTLAISLFGGHGSSETDAFAENFTPEQDAALRKLIADLRAKYPTIKAIRGHNEVAAKACPGFNVSKWLAAAPVRPAEAPSAPVADEIPQEQGGLWAAIMGLLRALGLVK